MKVEINDYDFIDQVVKKALLEELEICQPGTMDKPADQKYYEALKVVLRHYGCPQ